MPDGLSTYTADLMLAWLAGTAPPTPPTVYVQGHTGPPGAAGTGNVSSVTTREAVTFSAPSGGVLSASSVPQWVNWAGTSGEVWTDVSLWDAASGGNFLDSIELTGTWYEFTCTQASPGVLTVPDAGYANGQAVYLMPAAGSALPGGLAAATAYTAASVSGNSFNVGVSTTSAGAGLIAAAQPSNPILTGDTMRISSLVATLPVAA